MTIGKVVVVGGLAVVLVACGGKKTEPVIQTPVAPAVPTEAPATPAMKMPTVKHGGQMVMADDYHAEVVAGDKEIKAYFYDTAGQPMAPPAEGKVHIAMDDGDRASVPMKAHEDHLMTGDELAKAHFHKPYDAAIAVTVGGEQMNFRFTVKK